MANHAWPCGLLNTVFDNNVSETRDKKEKSGSVPPLKKPLFLENHTLKQCAADNKTARTNVN